MRKILKILDSFLTLRAIDMAPHLRRVVEQDVGIILDSLQNRVSEKDLDNLSIVLKTNLQKILELDPELLDGYLYWKLKVDPSDWEEIIGVFQEANHKVDILRFFPLLSEKAKKEFIASSYFKGSVEGFFGDIGIETLRNMEDLLFLEYLKYFTENIDKVIASNGSVFIFEVLERSGDEEVFRLFLDRLEPEKRAGFFSEVLFSFKDRSHGYELIMSLLRTFSEEMRNSVSLYLPLGVDTFFLEEHLYWVPKEKLLDYLKTSSPIHNYICYGLFGSDGLLPLVGTDKELLTLEEIEDLLEYFESSFDDNTYVAEAREAFDQFVKNMKKD